MRGGGGGLTDLQDEIVRHANQRGHLEHHHYTATQRNHIMSTALLFLYCKRTL